jgi:hypothetical protein
MSSDLINYNDLIERAMNTVPDGTSDKLQKVNNILNTAMGVHLLLSQYDFYKKTFGDFGDKMTQQGLDISKGLSNFIENPTSIMDSEVAGNLKNVVNDQVNKALLSFKPGQSIEMSNLSLPSTGELSNLGEMVSGFKPGEAVEAFKIFNKMREAPTSVFSGNDSLLNSLKGKVSEVKGSLKSLSKGDFQQAKQSLEEAIQDPEFGQFVSPLKMKFDSLSNQVQSALNERFNNIPDEMTSYLKNSGMNLDDIKLSLMEPQEFNTYLGTLKGVASDKVDEMRSAYQSSRNNAEDVINSIKNRASEAQQSINDIGDNLQNRLISVQESLENSLDSMNANKQFILDSTKQLTDIDPVKVVSNTSEDLGKSLAGEAAESAVGDEDPIGLAITGVLGLASLGDTIAEAIENKKEIPSQIGFQFGI